MKKAFAYIAAFIASYLLWSRGGFIGIAGGLLGVGLIIYSVYKVGMMVKNATQEMYQRTRTYLADRYLHIKNPALQRENIKNICLFTRLENTTDEELEKEAENFKEISKATNDSIILIKRGNRYDLYTIYQITEFSEMPTGEWVSSKKPLTTEEKWERRSLDHLLGKPEEGFFQKAKVFLKELLQGNEESLSHYFNVLPFPLKSQEEPFLIKSDDNALAEPICSVILRHYCPSIHSVEDHYRAKEIEPINDESKSDFFTLEEKKPIRVMSNSVQKNYPSWFETNSDKKEEGEKQQDNNCPAWFNAPSAGKGNEVKKGKIDETNPSWFTAPLKKEKTKK